MEKLWLKHYPKGVDAEISLDNYNNVIDVLNEGCKKFSERRSFVNMGKSLSFSEVQTLSDNFASYLQNYTDLKKGDRIAVQMPNLLQFPIAVFGALKAGLVVVNTNPLYTAREMKHQFNDSGAKAIVISTNFADKLEEILKDTPIKTVIKTDLGDLLGFPKKHIVNFVVKNVKKMVPSYHLPNAVSFNQALELGKKHSYTKVDVGLDDIAFLQYTGGTTGISKGAMLTHRNVVSNMQQITAWMKGKLVEGEEIVITPLPMYHIFSLTVNCLSFIKYGGTNVLITNPRDIPGFIKELKKWPFTVITGVNTLFNALLNNTEFSKIDFSTVKISVQGGMALQKAVAERWKKVTNTPLAEGYGLTETSPVASCNPIDGTEILGTIGMPLPSTQIKVVDEEGNELGPEQVGEICIKGPQVMKGYWQRPEETNKVLMDGWFKTGDMGVMEPNGYFKIVDRKKDMINVSGFNVYPNEIEDVLATHPKILEAGAVGVPDEHSGEVVKVFVVKKDNSLTEQEVIDFCKKNLTGYKVPKAVSFITELPKTNVGKILRRELR